MAAQREWFEKDYYQVLGVSNTATEKEITRAYRKLAKQFHPDANPGAEDRFKEISAAYDVLGDPAKRKEYDEVRRMGPIGNPFGGGGGGNGTGPFANVRVEDLGDIFGGMFRGAGRGRTRSTAGPRRGDDLEAELYLSFEDAIDGVTTTINVVSDAPCTSCHGTGAAPGTTPVICSVCGGRGVTDDNQGLFSFSTPCRACGGTGMRIETPCPTCRGTGNIRRPRQVKTKIQPGVEDGKRLRLKARGGAGHNGGPPGDLYVTVHVGRHELFGRQGKNLTLTVPISFAEAALGATVAVPTLTKPVNVKIPAGTRSGRTFRVRGHGVPDLRGAGDLLVTVEVTVPQHLTDEERRVIEELRDLEGPPPRSHLGV